MSCKTEPEPRPLGHTERRRLSWALGPSSVPEASPGPWLKSWGCAPGETPVGPWPMASGQGSPTGACSSVWPGAPAQPEDHPTGLGSAGGQVERPGRGSGQQGVPCPRLGVAEPSPPRASPAWQALLSGPGPGAGGGHTGEQSSEQRCPSRWEQHVQRRKCVANMGHQEVQVAGTSRGWGACWGRCRVWQAPSPRSRQD